MCTTKADPKLIAGLRAARKIARQTGLIGGVAMAAPANAYYRQLVNLAFLAPDLQQAILRGEQPAGINLERLLGQPIPLAWADQPQWLAKLALGEWQSSRCSRERRSLIRTKYIADRPKQRSGRKVG